MINDEMIDDAINDLDFSKNSLKDFGKGYLLTEFEIEILSKYNIDYKNCNTLKEILFMVEDILNLEDELEDLEQVSKSIAERDYYYYTNK